MKILIASITDSGIYRGRREFITELIANGHSVTIVSPLSDSAEKLIALGCKHIEVQIHRHGLNPLEELKLINTYSKVLNNVEPDMVFTFTIKPNLYLGILCRLSRIPYAMNITGLGEGLLHEGRAKQVILKLYPIATKRVSCIFFQNVFNRQFFIDHKLADPAVFRLLPGSGVNVENFLPIDYPDENRGVKFLFVSRIVKDKGVDELIEAIKVIKGKYNNVEFHLAGGCSEEYEESLNKWIAEGLVIYQGRKAPEEMKSLYGMSHCLIHPSYHEGMANVILESAACARPCIASNINGCKEGIDNGVTGYVFAVRSSQAIVERIEEFLLLTHDEKIKMGLAGRKKMEREFDRKIVTKAYLDVIKLVQGKL
ncbi:MAG: glycosyltransferase family 4 protein [Butyrivibrio sp.]|nr:glycosyltransferase family 4 protein [Butyrivibrio sp.]